jgi:ABC-type Zn2+ transport system substrate-binding protein/surface adhesin
MASRKLPWQHTTTIMMRMTIMMKQHEAGHHEADHHKKANITTTNMRHDHKHHHDRDHHDANRHIKMKATTTMPVLDPHIWISPALVKSPG